MRWDLYDFLTTAAGNLDLLVHDAGEAQPENRIKRATLATLLPVKTWSPVWNNLNVGNGTLTAKYIQDGNLVYGHLELEFGSTTSISGDVSFTPPITAGTYGATSSPIGQGRYLVAGSAYDGIVTLLTTTSIRITVSIVSGTFLQSSSFSAATPATWGSGDNIRVTFWYFTV